METYLEKLLSQIRCKKARPYIAEEIRDHIECQIADNLSEGMTSEEAEKNAVADMGDPVEVGISLDRIHKPKIAWRLLVIVGILSLLGILIQQSILRQPGYQELETWRQEVYRYTTEGFVSCIADRIPSHVCDLLPRLYRNCKVLQVHRRAILILGGLRLPAFRCLDVNGVGNWIGFGMLRVSITSLMMFYVPIYGAILYKYRDGGVSALCRAILWLILPVFITFRIPSLGVAVIMMVSMLIELTVAVWKGWFQLPVKKTIIGMWLLFTQAGTWYLDCKVRISYAGNVSGSQDPFLFIPFRRCQLHDGHAS